VLRVSAAARDSARGAGSSNCPFGGDGCRKEYTAPLASASTTAFALDDPEATIAWRWCASPLLKREAIDSSRPTQQHSPQFADRLQLVLIDGPHGYPFRSRMLFIITVDEDALLITTTSIFQLSSASSHSQRRGDVSRHSVDDGVLSGNSTPLFNPCRPGGGCRATMAALPDADSAAISRRPALILKRVWRA
jgi:hypothetical protein